MIHTTFIARVSDGLMLCENYSDSSQSVQLSKKKAKQLIKEKSKFMETCAIIDMGEHLLIEKNQDGIIYLVLIDQKYPQKLARFYLDEIQKCFLDMLLSHYGSDDYDLKSKIEVIDEAYHFIKFGKILMLDRTIVKKQQEYLDVRSNKNLDLLKSDLNNLHKIMTQNIDLILDRENSLQKIGDKATFLKEGSKQFKDKTRDLAWNLWFKKNLLYIIISGLFLLFFYLKFM